LIEPIPTGKYPRWAVIIGRIIGGIVTLIIVKLLVEPRNPPESGYLPCKNLSQLRMIFTENFSRCVLALPE